MLCPRCKQGSSVSTVQLVRGEKSHHFCHACSLTFDESTQVIRPIQVDSIWIEVGTGSVVRVLGIEGDAFDPSTPIRFRSDTYPETSSNVMLSEDFRYYFRPRRDPKPPKAVMPPCKPGDEWESVSGGLYTILSVNKDGDVFMVSQDAEHLSFWVKGHDFVRMFARFLRPTDYSRLLDDG